MKDLYCCPLMRSGTFDLRKVMLSIVVVMAFVLNGSAANIYMEDSESNSQSVQVNNNVGSSVDNLLNLSTKLDAAAQWLAFTSDGSTMSKLAASPVVCPCPKNTAPVLSVSSQAFDLECIGEIPAPPIVTANDDCDGPVNVQEFYFTNELGETHCTLADAHGDISPQVRLSGRPCAARCRPRHRRGGGSAVPGRARGGARRMGRAQARGAAAP